MNRKLESLRVAVLATDGFEEEELTKPVDALRELGATVHIVSLKPGKIQAFRHHDKSIQVNVDRLIANLSAADYDALLIPGGALNADAMRAEPHVQDFIREMDAAKKPIAAICHAAWELISACVVKGRTLTSYYTIADDIRNAGGHWVDREVEMDFNWVTSRKPEDIPVFNREMINTFASLRPERTVTARS